MQKRACFLYRGGTLLLFCLNLRNIKYAVVCAAQIATVRDVLGETGARSIPEIVVFNKADLIGDDERLVLRGLQPDALFASARTGAGVDDILARIAELLPRPEVPVSLLVPFDRGDVIAMLHDRFDVVTERYEEAGTRIDAKVSDAVLSQLAEFRV